MKLLRIGHEQPTCRDAAAPVIDDLRGVLLKCLRSENGTDNCHTARF